MRNATWDKNTSDLRRLLHQDFSRAGKFMVAKEGQTIYVHHQILNNIICTIDFTERDGDFVAIFQYRPKSYYVSYIQHLLEESGVRYVISLPETSFKTRAFENLPQGPEMKAERIYNNMGYAEKLKVKSLVDPYIPSTTKGQKGVDMPKPNAAVNTDLSHTFESTLSVATLFNTLIINQRWDVTGGFAITIARLTPVIVEIRSEQVGYYYLRKVRNGVGQTLYSCTSVDESRLMHYSEDQPLYHILVDITRGALRP